jgi:ATPase subunit of ABC transporter with duplicated ATPase domains
LLASSLSSATLVASNISCEIEGRLVLSDVSLTVDSASRLGVIGPNGVGKSTLLRILAGQLQPDSGTVELAPPAASVGYLAQESDHPMGATVGNYLRRVTGVAAAEEGLHRAADAFGEGGKDAAEKYVLALERWQRLGAEDIDARIDAAIAKFGLPAELADQEMLSLSGGQAARIALAGIELSRFDITLLDEPTNDLDFEGLERLGRFIRERTGGMVIVSHDRAFLENTIDAVLELDEHDHRARLFRGGWSAYLDERSTARRHAKEKYDDYATKRQVLLERARRERHWATSGTAREKRRPKDHDKAQRDFRLNRTEQLAARARRTERALARLVPVEKPWEGWDLRFSIAEAPRAGAVVARLDAAVIMRGDFQLGPIDIEIAGGERVALSGANGSGKTSLIEALLGTLPLQSGTRWLGPSVVIGELGQRRSTYVGEGTLLSRFMGATGLDAGAARSALAKFGLGANHVMRAADSCSPGERTRAELAGFQARGVNFLVLDEPTNHLDLPAVEQLEEALSSYRGTLLVVSHDRRFLESLEIERTVNLGGQGIL